LLLAGGQEYWGWGQTNLGLYTDPAGIAGTAAAAAIIGNKL
jgi:hypothetical protein